MSGIDRYIHVLDLFTTEKSMWTVQEVAAALNVPTSTTYRTMRELARVSMLEPATEGSHGPAGTGGRTDADRHRPSREPSVRRRSCPAIRQHGHVHCRQERCGKRSADKLRARPSAASDARRHLQSHTRPTHNSPLE